jgi:hypothetical protein
MVGKKFKTYFNNNKMLLATKCDTKTDKIAELFFVHITSKTIEISVSCGNLIIRSISLLSVSLSKI